MLSAARGVAIMPWYVLTSSLVVAHLSNSMAVSPLRINTSNILLDNHAVYTLHQ